MHRRSPSPPLRTVLVVLGAAALVLGAAACSDTAAPEGGAAGASTTASTATPAGGDSTAAAGEVAPWEQVLAPPSCRCSNGSPFSFWVRRADPAKVLFYLEGGGACFSAETCGGDQPTFTADLEGRGEPGASGIFDASNPANPLAGYSVVYVPYCTGDLHLGTTVHDYGSGIEIQHVGYTNASTALGAAAALFPDATDVVVAGSSAGSAGAPMFGGAAHDVWPDADVAVIADASAAYPGDAGITLAIGSLWGTSGAIPNWPETAGDPPEAWSLPGLFVESAKHDPALRFATYNNAFDEVQSQFSQLIGVDPTHLVDLIDANNQSIRDHGVDIVNWVAAGTTHTILGRDDLYDLETDGNAFVDWLTAFVAGGEVADVHCTDCEPPS